MRARTSPAPPCLLRSRALARDAGRMAAVFVRRVFDANDGAPLARPLVMRPCEVEACSRLCARARIQAIGLFILPL